MIKRLLFVYRTECGAVCMFKRRNLANNSAFRARKPASRAKGLIFHNLSCYNLKCKINAEIKRYIWIQYLTCL